MTLHGEIRNERSVASFSQTHRICERFCSRCGWERVIGTLQMAAWTQLHQAHDPDFTPRVYLPVPDPEPPDPPEPPPPKIRAWYQDFQRWLRKHG